MVRIRFTLRIGAIVFGSSALLLLAAPGLFLDLLLLDGQSAPLQWAMRMIGFTLVALAANMWLVGGSAPDAAVVKAGVVMAIVAGGLGVLTLMIPTELGWFAFVYAGVGFAFSLSYVVLLLGLRFRR